MAAPAAGGDKNRWASDCFRKGTEAVNKKNWDLAIEMFGMCVKLVPDNIGFRQNLRGVTKKKYNDNGSGAGALAKAKLVGLRSRIKKSKAAKNWEDADKACEEGLLVNPWDVGLNVDLGEICKETERTDMSAWAYGLARQGDMNNLDINIALANVLEERGQYAEAAGVWRHLYKLDPKNGQARSKIAALETKTTIEAGGYEGAKNTGDVRVNKEVVRKGEVVAPGQSVEIDMRHAIRKEPQNKGLYLKLADHLRKNRKLDEARETLNQALEISGNDPAITEILEDVELDQLALNLDAAKQTAAASGKDTDRQNTVALAQELLKRQIEVLSARVEKYPADLGRKYDLALLLMRIQKWQQAIPNLQKASQDPRMRGKALVALGECFLYDKKGSLARGQFERALPELSFDQEPDMYKKTYYNLGRICEEVGDKAAAEKYYGEVLVVDYEYKDANERLTKLQGGE
ncbi:Tetratricopeptide repeat protein [Caulifigura coniformis]|uniref:Tetratricopeptide repeat protein n=1 Tax=Caulifigura coniformis TaxID=2527983 RepID=A0A517SB14_9PLAN|nr:tetratricopeptide repeat protein [Caulifigura coniformis]QDT53266.1 Tetratricopeptide repeat protein [Caulifigura coniformis]